MHQIHLGSFVEMLAVGGGVTVGLGIDSTRASKRLRVLVAAAVICALAVVALPCLMELLARLAKPPLFDYTAFWISARAAVDHLNFYDPRVCAAIAAPLPLTALFVREIVDVGFWYPPPSMLLFFPLGLLAYRPGLILMDAISVAAFVAAGAVLTQLFFAKRGWLGYALSALLMLSLDGALQTFAGGQWTFVALLFTLLCLRANGTAGAGVWAVLATLTKPWLAVLIGASLLRRQHKALVAAVVTTAGVSAAAVGAFGPATVGAYFQVRHYAALPPWIYSEITNQSLHAFLLRHVDAATVKPAFLAGTAIVGGVSAVLIWVVDDRRRFLTSGLAICGGLIVYPVTQVFYDLLLVVPLCVLWLHAQAGPARWAAAVLFASVALVTRLPLDTSHVLLGDATFGAFVFLWVTFAVVCGSSVVRRSAGSGRVERRELSDAVA